ncbi:hypothetical protein VOLCADRAFT_86669 [Volvox carteri f. nagariensis]|uniref:Uncharacterized protein n=1 Tax=Volvox carteri f. nagariensis TaxID=3068 RepID=D8TJA3_VOLCA|nr:uncharacterized protein VOLCADRAFT_86669 [Volvox carteri f. nagariensis]EFJ52340.1 hypothetical protein VOLCADRAFT_86669 [Volvox carteri f. nagariensis]|eukprot:XP_002946413.1 hypothetical protein VOLCADRAFT_86669 [Volvox carteri f. nagariensis]
MGLPAITDLERASEVPSVAVHRSRRKTRHRSAPMQSPAELQPAHGNRHPYQIHPGGPAGPSSRSGSKGSANATATATGGTGAGLASKILAAAEWRQLTDLVIQSLAPVQTPSDRAAAAAVPSNASDAAAGPDGEDLSPASTLGKGQGTIQQDTTAAAAAAGGNPPGPPESGRRCQLSESDLLLVLWRLVCSGVLRPGGMWQQQPQPQQSLRSGVARPGLLPPPLLPPPPPSALPSMSTGLQSQQLWPGAAAGLQWLAPSPFSPFKSGPTYGLMDPLTGGLTTGGWGPRNGEGARRGRESSEDDSLLPSGFRSPRAPTAAVLPPPPPAALTGSSVARQRCLAAVSAAARQLAPGMSPRSLVAALELLAHWTRAVGGPQVDERTSVRGRGGGGGDDEDAMWQLAEPFLAAVATSASSTSQWGPSELLAVGAVILSSLEQLLLPAPAPPLLPLGPRSEPESRGQQQPYEQDEQMVVWPGGEGWGAQGERVEVGGKGERAGEGEGCWLAAEWVGMLWAEVMGKAASLDSAGCVGALLELTWYVEVGGGTRPHAQQERAGGVATGVGRVRQLTATLFHYLPPQLAGCSPDHLAAAMTAAATLHEYGCVATAAVQLQYTSPSPSAPKAQVDSAAGVQDGLDKHQHQQQAAPRGSTHLILEPAARALLRHVRSHRLTLPQLGACVTALARLVTSGTPPPPGGTATARASRTAASQDGTTDPAAPSPAPPAAAALASLLLEVPPEVLRCAVGGRLKGEEEGIGRRVMGSGGGGGGGALGPEGLAWLLPLEASLVALEEELLPRLPLLRQLLQSKQQQQVDVQEEAVGGAVVEPGPAAASGYESARGTGGRGLAARVIAAVLGGVRQLSLTQLLHLAAASQQPQTSRLFSEAARRDIVLALVESPLASPSPPQPAAPSRAGGPRRFPPLPPPPPPQQQYAASILAVLPEVVQSLRPESLVAVLCAAARRQAHFDACRLAEQREPLQPPQRRRESRHHLPADLIAAVALSAALSRLLDLASPESQPGFMDAPRRTAAGAELSTDQWCDALAAIAQAAHALAAPPALLPSSPAAAGLGAGESRAVALTPVTLLQLLNALRPVWPAMRPSQAVAAFTQLADLHEAVQLMSDARESDNGGGGGGIGDDGSAGAVTGGPPSPSSPQKSSAARGGSVAAAAAAMGPGPADWHVAQRAVAATARRLTARELAAMVTAAARLAAVAPLCDEWMEALTQVLLAPPPAPAPLAGGLAALDSVSALELLRGCVELKAAAGPDQDGIMLPVLPVLERLGVSCSDVCRLLPRLAVLVTEPPLAAIVGTSALPLLGYLQRTAFSGARLGDLLAALTGLSRLMLRPEPAWSAALCAATMPLLRNPATALTDQAALAHAMAQAWVMPTPEWHQLLMAATGERMARGSGSGSSGKGQALEQLLWAQAIWYRRSSAAGGPGDEGTGAESGCAVSSGGSSAGDGSGSAGAGVGAGSYVFKAPGGWLDQLVAASVPLLPSASPQVPANMLYVCNALGYDPGPDFISALLQGSTASLSAFTGPQLSRLAHGLARLGYQPEDPWVTALQLSAARALHECDTHDLADLLEGVLLLEMGREVEAVAAAADGGVVEQGETAGAGFGRNSREDHLEADEDPDAEDLNPELDLDFESDLDGSDLDAALDALLSDPDFDVPAIELFLIEFWEASAGQLSADAMLMSEAVARRRSQPPELFRTVPMSRRQDLQMVERLKAEFRERITDPQVGPFWRYWTEQVPFLDPSLVAPDSVLADELADLAPPLFDGAATGTDSLPRLQRFLTWAVLRTGELPAPLPEGVSPWAGHMAARCVELLGGPRAAAALPAPAPVAEAAAAGELVPPPPRHLRRENGGGVVRVAPPVDWVSVLQLSQVGAMLLAGGVWSQRRQLLRTAQAAVTWASPPLAEWGEAFLRASRTAFFGDSAQEMAAAASAERSAGGSGPSNGHGGAPGGAAARYGDPGSQATEAASGTAAGSTTGGSRPLEVGELLELLMSVLALDLAPGSSWLGAAEAASLPLLRGCQAEEAVALALALQRLGHAPGREWAAALLSATRAMGTRRAALSAVSVAALLVCLWDLRVRPTDAWLDDALAALVGRQGELPATLLARLLATLAGFEVRPSSEWLAPAVEGFWGSLEELLMFSQDVEPLVQGLGAISALEMPVKQSHLTALLALLSKRLGLGEGAAAAEFSDTGDTPTSAASATAASVARVLICLAGMRRATPSRSNRNTLDAIFTAVAERLPVSGPLTPKLLDSWDKLVPPRHPSLTKGHGEHKNSKASRRGPMDEMRQLVRILVKLMPESSRFLTVPDEGGGGNRVKEEHIKDYLNKVLGRSQDLRDDGPPYPDWGLVNGWAAYLSELFTWARGAPITPDQALRCARRLPGRSWETLNDELEKLRLCPQAWPLPLRKEAVREVQKKYEETGQLPPVVQRPPAPVQLAATVGPQLMLVDASAVAAGAVAAGPGDFGQLNSVDAQPGVKRLLGNGHLGEIDVVQASAQPVQQSVQVAGAQGGQAVYTQVAGHFAQHAPHGLAAAAWPPQPPAPKRRKKPGSSGMDFINLSEYSELELWHLALKVLQEAESKRNTTSSNKLGDLQTTHDMVRRVVERFTPSAGASGVVSLSAPMVGPPAGVTPGYPAQTAHQAQAAAAPGGPPALVAMAPSPSTSGNAAAAAAAAAASMDTAAQLKARLMVLPQGGLAGAPPGPQSSASQGQQAQGTPGTLSGVSGQAQTAASLTTIQQPVASHQLQGYAGLAPVLTPPQQPPQHLQPSQQTLPAPPQQTQQQASPQQQQQQQPTTSQQQQQPAAAVPAASGGPTTSGRHEGGSVAKPTTTSDTGTKVLTTKETCREASSRPGDVRLASSAFQKYENQKLSEKFDNSKYEKGSGGLEALAAAAAELGERCGAEQEDQDAKRRAPSSDTGAASPTLALSSGQHASHQSVLSGAEHQMGARAGGGAASPSQQPEQRRGEDKASGRGAVTTAMEEMDETETRGTHHLAPPADSVASPQTLIYHLLPPVESLAALAHRGIVPMPYPAQLGLGQQIINTGQQYLLVTGQMPSLVTSQMQGQYVLAAAPATATISASVPIGVSSPAVVQPQVVQP